MQRPALALVALLLLAQPVLAADPGARTPLDLGQPASDVDLAVVSGTIAAGSDDPGSRLAGTPDETVWWLYTADGRNLLQDGDADSAACDQGSLLETCTAGVTHVAVNRDGSKMVVGSASDDAVELLFVTDRAGPGTQVQLEGTLVGLAISDEGGNVVAVTALPQGQANRTRVHHYTWGATITSWQAQAVEPANALALAPDGTTFVVASGTDHVRYRSSGAASAVIDTGFTGTATAVAISNTAQHVSVAGSSEGYFILYADGTTRDQRELRIRDANVAVTAVAMRSDGTALAVGNSAGDVWVYGLDPVLITLSGQMGRLTLPGPIHELAFARDGASLAIAAGSTVQQYALDAGALVPLWSTTLTSSAGRIAITERGASVAAAAGNAIHIFEARHVANVTVPAPAAVAPGSPLSLPFTVRNSGNRIESLTFTLAAPTGWNATTSTTALRLAPDQSAVVVVNATLPATTAPGSYEVRLQLASSTGVPASTTTVPVTVPTVEAWSLAPAGALSLAITAGGAQSYQFQVTNRGNTAQTPALQVTTTPTGWSAALLDVGVVQPGQSAAVGLTMSAPASAARGASGIAAVTLANATGSPLSFVGTVGATFAVQLGGTGAVTGTAGSNATATLQVRNTGNAADGFRLQAGGVPNGWSLTFEGGATNLDLPLVDAGETVDVPVTVGIGPNAAAGPPYDLVFTATSIGDPSRSDPHHLLVTVTAASTTPTDDGDGSNGAPGPGLLLAPLLLAGAAWARSASKRR